MKEKKLQESLVLIWGAALHQLLADWLELLQSTEKPTGLVLWNKTVEIWQTTVQETLTAQDKWLHEWKERFPITSGSPTDLRKNVQQALVVLLGWTKVQQEVWQGWFKLIRQFEPLLEAGSPVDESLLLNLRQSGEALATTQEELMRQWFENPNSISQEENCACKKENAAH